MFSDTYGRVQAQSLDIWHKQNYGMALVVSRGCCLCGSLFLFLMAASPTELYMEYRDRPFFPPPFILGEHLIRLLVWLVRKCKGHKDEPKSEKQRQLEVRLILFQELNTDK
jgi:hypothetical protein